MCAHNIMEKHTRLLAYRFSIPLQKTQAARRRITIPILHVAPTPIESTDSPPPHVIPLYLCPTSDPTAPTGTKGGQYPNPKGGLDS